MELFNVEMYASIILVDKHEIIHNFMNIRSNKWWIFQYNLLLKAFKETYSSGVLCKYL